MAVKKGKFPKTKPKTPQERHKERSAQAKKNKEQAAKDHSTDAWVKKQLALANKAIRDASVDVPTHPPRRPSPSWHTQQGRAELKRRKAWGKGK